VARNRKRAKERRARRPQPVAARTEREEEAPEPIEHAAPDVELAEAQLAVGRSEVATEPEEAADLEEELEYEAEASEEPAATEEAEARSDSASEIQHRGPPIDLVVVLLVLLVLFSVAGGLLVSPLFLLLLVLAVFVQRARARAGPEHPEFAGRRLIDFLQGSWRELQRVQWPDRRQVIQATGVVIGFVIIAGAFLGVADFFAGKVMNFVLTGHFK
jgi:preprotein translocase subunit SecE